MQAARWTEFLKERTPRITFDALNKFPEPEEKLGQRQNVFSQMFLVAAAEEAYRRGASSKSLNAAKRTLVDVHRGM